MYTDNSFTSTASERPQLSSPLAVPSKNTYPSTVYLFEIRLLQWAYNSVWTRTCQHQVKVWTLPGWYRCPSARADDEEDVPAKGDRGDEGLDSVGLGPRGVSHATEECDMETDIEKKTSKHREGKKIIFACFDNFLPYFLVLPATSYGSQQVSVKIKRCTSSFNTRRLSKSLPNSFSLAPKTTTKGEAARFAG